MSIQLQFRRGNTAQTAVFTGAVAELTVDTDKNTVILHDGVTAGGYALARESALSANQAIAQNAFNKANAAYDAANTKFNSAGGTISGNVVVTGNVSPTTDNVYSLGSASYRWKDIFVGAGTVDIDGVKLSKVSNQLVISGATDLVLSGTSLPSSTNTANNIANAFNQANLAYDAANTAFTAGGARAFDQANLAFDKANSAWDYANSAYGTANNEILTRQANVGAAVITLTGNYEANVGAGLISNKLASDVNVGSAIAQGQANVGVAVISVTNAYQANVGAGLIANKLASDVNVGAGLITVTNNYQANVGQLRLDTGNANTSLAANIGAARIADTAAAQANTGAGLISLNTSLTNAYQANVGAARISDTASAQANTGAGLIANKLASDANVGAGLISTTSTITSAYQANVGAGLITVTNGYQANAGAGLITKVAKAGDTMTGRLSTSGSLIGSSITSNTIVTVNTHSIYEATAVTTSTTAQVVLDFFPTATYRSAKYLVQITSGSSYELLELTLIHDGTTVYLSQYGNIKTGATLGVFDATISAGTLFVYATPNNAITTFKTAATLIPT